MASSSPPWINSISCSGSVVQSSADSSLPLVFQWLRFVLLSPCPQRALLASVDLLFLLVLIIFAFQKLFARFTSAGRRSTSDVTKPLIGRNSDYIRTDIWFKLSLIAAVLLTAGYTVVCILAFSGVTDSPWKVVGGSFWLIQALTQAVIAILIIHEKKFRAVTHPLSLRIYWIASFIMVTCFMISGIVHLVSHETNLILDDIVSIVSFPFSIVLLTVAIRGKTGIIVARETKADDEENELYETLLDKSNVSGFASASNLSKTFWIWMNPLLSKGYKSPLKMDDVPTLSPEHRAERMSRIFGSNWPKPEEKCDHPVRTTLLRCFWREIAFTACLAILRLCVMYVGPVLIQSFVDYTAGKRSSPYEGYYLVITLLAAKFVEVLTVHQFNFNSQKLRHAHSIYSHHFFIQEGIEIILLCSPISWSWTNCQLHGC